MTSLEDAALNGAIEWRNHRIRCLTCNGANARRGLSVRDCAVGWQLSRRERDAWQALARAQ